MSLTAAGIPDNRALLGPSNWMRPSQFAAGVSDYVTGGYIITAQTFEFAQIFDAWIAGVNAAASVYLAQIVFPASSMIPTPGPATTINLKILQASAGPAPFVELAAGTNLTGLIWTITAIGF